MNPEEHDLPDPDMINSLADEMPRKVPVKDYRDAMETMRAKGYSYQEIAAWLSDKLKAPVNRNQVGYVLNSDPEHDEDGEDPQP